MFGWDMALWSPRLWLALRSCPLPAQAFRPFLQTSKPLASVQHKLCDWNFLQNAASRRHFRGPSPVMMGRRSAKIAARKEKTDGRKAKLYGKVGPVGMAQETCRLAMTLRLVPGERPMCFCAALRRAPCLAGPGAGVGAGTHARPPPQPRSPLPLTVAVHRSWASSSPKRPSWAAPT